LVDRLQRTPFSIEALRARIAHQSMSIVVETIEARKRRKFLVDSRAKIFDGLAIGV
jgi:hypothetical protein